MDNFLYIILTGNIFNRLKLSPVEPTQVFLPKQILAIFLLNIFYDIITY